VAAYPHQAEWAESMADLLREAKRRGEAAAAAGLDEVPIGVRKWLRGRYNAIIEDAFAANPEPNSRQRNAAERASHNLAVALEHHAEEILLFLYDLRVPFDNNQAERDLRMAKLLVYRPSGVGLRVAV
jgi:transposase